MYDINLGTDPVDRGRAAGVGEVLGRVWWRRKSFVTLFRSANLFYFCSA